MQNRRVIAAISAASLLLTPALALAQTPPPAGKGAAFCTNLTTISSKINANVDEREQKISQHRTDATAKNEARWSASQQKLVDARSADDAKRAEQYAKLDTKATTDGEKAAVAAFKSTVDAAVVTRRAAVDAAIAAYRSGIDAAVATNSSNISAAQATFDAAVDAALAEANADCAAEGADSLAIRTEMHNAIKAAQDAFKTSRKDGSLQTTQKELAATRKQAVDKAMTDFKAVLDAAAATLRAAFPPDGSQ